MTHMQILVTGGAGFIGSHIVDDLREAGHAVVVLDNLDTGKRENIPSDVPLHVVDLRDREGVAKVIAEVRPDAVSHQAAQASVSLSVREPATDAAVNVMGGLNLLDACVSHGVPRVVFASTGGAIYGNIPRGAASVDTRPDPQSPYACSKAAFETYLRNYHLYHDLEYQVLRYANVYGPRQDPYGEAGVIAIFATRRLRGEPVQLFGMRAAGDGGCIRDYTFVRDVARLNRMALEGSLEPRIANVGTGIGTTTRDLLGGIDAILGTANAVDTLSPRPGDVERSVLDPGDTIRTALGTFTSLAEGLRETVAWFRNNS